VRLLHADGRQSYWLAGGRHRPMVKLAGGRSGFVALELPESELLRRNLQIPSLSDEAVAQAAALEVRSISPFTADDLVWGYGVIGRTKGVLQIEIVLASRRHVEQYLAGQSSRWASKTPPEVWALAGEQAASLPIVMAGFGEERRHRRFIVLRNSALALIILAAGIAAAIAVTPTAQLRLRAIEALAAYTGLQQRTEPLLKQRAAFLQSAERATALGGMLGNRVDVLQALDVLTKALPDDTSLQMLQVQGTKVTLSGQTSNVAALMQKLSTQTGLKDVKAPSGTARPPGAQKENFTIELQLEPKALQATPPPTAQQPGTLGAAMAGDAVAGKGLIPAASGPIASMPPANAPAPLAQTTAPASAASVPKAATPVSSPFAIGGSKPAPQGKPVP